MRSLQGRTVDLIAPFEMPIETGDFMAWFRFCQCSETADVIRASHDLSRAFSNTSAVEKNFVEFGAGFPNGRNNRAATRIGMSWH